MSKTKFRYDADVWRVRYVDSNLDKHTVFLVDAVDDSLPGNIKRALILADKCIENLAAIDEIKLLRSTAIVALEDIEAE